MNNTVLEPMQLLKERLSSLQKQKVAILTEIKQSESIIRDYGRLQGMLYHEKIDAAQPIYPQLKEIFSQKSGDEINQVQMNLLNTLEKTAGLLADDLVLAIDAQKRTLEERQQFCLQQKETINIELAELTYQIDRGKVKAEKYSVNCAQVSSAVLKMAHDTATVRNDFAGLAFEISGKIYHAGHFKQIMEQAFYHNYDYSLLARLNQDDSFEILIADQTTQQHVPLATMNAFSKQEIITLHSSTEKDINWGISSQASHRERIAAVM